jgi:putative two-component system response regulator
MSERKKQTIMLVDDNQTNLTIGKNMLKDSYEVFALSSAEKLLDILEDVTPDLILLDIDMPGMNGFDAIKILKADTKLANIPVMFVTARSEESNELDGLDLGAVDYVTKPFSAAILLRRIENYLLIEKQKAELKKLNGSLIGMVREKSAQISGLHNSMINIVAEIVEFRDAHTGGHISRTQKYVEALINKLIQDQLYVNEMQMWENPEYIAAATQLHDIGKIFISDTILNKPEKLTNEEFEIMKTHTVKGVEALKLLEKNGDALAFLKCAQMVAGTHHEKWDGSGYPAGLKGLNIPLLGRLMAIADVYDALTSARSYKPPFSAEESANIIMEGSGTHFDPALIEVFKTLTDDFAAINEQESDHAVVLKELLQ